MNNEKRTVNTGTQFTLTDDEIALVYSLAQGEMQRLQKQIRMMLQSTSGSAGLFNTYVAEKEILLKRCITLRKKLSQKA